jgi:hypothetical protein
MKFLANACAVSVKFDAGPGEMVVNESIYFISILWFHAPLRRTHHKHFRIAFFAVSAGRSADEES